MNDTVIQLRKALRDQMQRYRSVRAMAKAFGIPPATAYWLANNKPHDCQTQRSKSRRLNQKTVKKLLASPKLPAHIRTLLFTLNQGEKP